MKCRLSELSTSYLYLIYDCHNVVTSRLKLGQKQNNKKNHQNGPDLVVTRRENHNNVEIEKNRSLKM